MLKVLASEQPVELANHDALLMAHDGAKVPLIDGATPIRDELGKIIRVVLVFRAAAKSVARAVDSPAA